MADALVLSGRAAIITGAASGIGRAIAREAAERGMDLALCDIDADGLAALSGAIEAKGRQVLYRKVDVRDSAEVEAFASASFDRFGSIAAVFANAGILKPADGIRPDLAIWDDTIDVNLRGVVHCVRAFLAPLVARAEPAQFVITGSQASFLFAREIAPYIATKHAVWGLADTLRLELKAIDAPVGISFLAPGRVRSGITAATSARVREGSGDAAAADYDRQLAEPADVARLTLDRVEARAFWILPDTSFVPVLQARIDELMSDARG